MIGLFIWLKNTLWLLTTSLLLLVVNSLILRTCLIWLLSHFLDVLLLFCFWDFVLFHFFSQNGWFSFLVVVLSKFNIVFQYIWFRLLIFNYLSDGLLYFTGSKLLINFSCCMSFWFIIILSKFSHILLDIFKILSFLFINLW